MSTGHEDEAPQKPPTIDASFRSQKFHIEVSVSHARAHMAELLDDVQDGGTVYLTHYGKRIAAIVPADAAEYLERLEDDYWGKRADEALADPEPSIPWEEVVRELEAMDQQ